MDKKVLEIVHRYLGRNNGAALCRKCNKVVLRCPETWTVERVLRREKICRSCDEAKNILRGHIPPAPIGTLCACQPCGKRKITEADRFDGDHKIPLSVWKGDPCDSANIRYLCESCNRSKQDDNYCKIHKFYLGA
jgi:5-methylcytosine-specific restriction endonuclease McrA